MSKFALFFGATLVVCQLTNSSWAQKNANPQEGPPNPPFPGDSQITFEWNYSCPTGQACTFTCPGSSGGSRVTKLELYLGSIPIGNNQRTAAIFYNFSTQYFPRGNGFSISTGIGVLSCQVNGMTLDYSGPPKM
jgi:hypothetical protein